MKLYKDRKCPRCGHYPNNKGHDHCIQNKRFVKAACCGHGIEEPYIYYYHQYFYNYYIKLQILLIIENIKIWMGIITEEDIRLMFDDF